MPLLDHFREPHDPRADWQSFHHRWANAIADELDRILPSRFFARVEMNVGRYVEADISEHELTEGPGANGGGGGVAVQTYAPPAATAVIPAIYPDDAEVQVRDEREGVRLAAVVELVSPANKDRPDTRRAFAAKCSAYLNRGVGVVVVDAVTDRHFNLHDELMTLLGTEGATPPAPDALYAVAYRPTRRQERNETDIWLSLLALGQPLPTLPLALRGYGCVPLDLEATYTDTRRRSRLT